MTAEDVDRPPPPLLTLTILHPFGAGLLAYPYSRGLSQQLCAYTLDLLVLLLNIQIADSIITRRMPSKYLYGFYSFFTLGLAIAGIISIVFSMVWRRQDMMLNMTFSNSDLNGTSGCLSPLSSFHNDVCHQLDSPWVSHS